MGRDHSTTKIAAADLRGLLDTMTPPERQCTTTQMSPLIAEELAAHSVLREPQPPLPAAPTRMSVASSELEPLAAAGDDRTTSERGGDLLIFVGIFVASTAVGGFLMAL